MNARRLVSLTSRTFLAAILAACSIIGSGCGDDGKSAAVVSDPVAEARTRMIENSQNPQALAGLETWIEEQIRLAGDETVKRSLTDIRSETRSRMATAFKRLANERAAEGDVDKINKIRAWADERLAVENARPEADRDALGVGLHAARRDLLFALLQKNPGDVAIRQELGFKAVKLEEKLADEDFMTFNKELQKDIGKLAVRFERHAEKAADGAIWLAHDSKDLAEHERILAAVDKERTAHDERMKDPFQAAALKSGKAAGDDVIKILENNAYRWVIYAEAPYVIIIERDDSWNEVRVAQEEIAKLMDLYNHFYGEYREVLDLRDITEPVPVIMFKRANAYSNLAKKTNVGAGAAGHFDGSTGRLFVSNETGSDTLIHEGTHQLVAYNTKGDRLGGFIDRSYWFGEGVAEYFGGSHRYLDPKDKQWHWELGVLQTGRIDYWRQNQHKAYKLRDLLNLTIRDREMNKSKGDDDLNLFVYSQGWFLVFFLNNFKVDQEGYVQVGEPGKYREGWLKFFRHNLEGGGTRDDFFEALGLLKDKKLDDEAFKVFEKDFYDYWEFVNRKVAGSSAGHVKERQLVPWDKAKNRRGETVTEKDDDLLIPRRD